MGGFCILSDFIGDEVNIIHSFAAGDLQLVENFPISGITRFPLINGFVQVLMGGGSLHFLHYKKQN